MSNDPDFECRINNQLATVAENQARFDEKMAVMQEAIAGLIQVARIHDEQIDRNSQQIKENSEAIKELREGLREQRENINALIRIMEGHITNHP
jgi:peptidoglycan hydrolase CwlO-like protein